MESIFDVKVVFHGNLICCWSNLVGRCC